MFGKTVIVETETRSKLQIYSTRSSYLCGLIFLAKNLDNETNVSQKTASYFVDN